MQITLQIKKTLSTLICFWQVIFVRTNLFWLETVKKKSVQARLQKSHETTLPWHFVPLSYFLKSLKATF